METVGERDTVTLIECVGVSDVVTDGDAEIDTDVDSDGDDDADADRVSAVNLRVTTRS